MKLRLKFVYGICPALIFVVRQFGLNGLQGNARSFMVFIRRDHWGEEALLEHELTHVKQFYRFFPLIPTHAILYKFSKKYRLNCEVEAYKKQLSFYDDQGPFVHERKLIGFAMSLTKNYGLNITQGEAEELLCGK